MVGDVSVDNATRANSFASITDNNSRFTLQITPNANQGDISISVAANALADLADNGNALTSLTVQDNASPTLTLVSGIPAAVNAATAAFTLRSTEGGTVSMSNNCGTVSPTSLDAGDNETFTLTGLTNGTSYSGCQVRVTDRGGNIATQALNSFTYDTTAITLDITDTVSGLTNQSSFTAYFAFNKPVESFVADNISLSHGTKGNLTAIGAVGGFADNYSMEITGVSNTVQITVAANAGRDNASNTGPANAVTHNVSYDGAAQL